MKKRWYKFPVNSIRFRVGAAFVIVIVALLMLLFLNNVYAMQVVRNQVYEANQQSLYWYVHQLDTALGDIEKYLVGMQLSGDNLRRIGNPKDDVDLYTAQSLMKREMEAALPSYGMLDALFVINVERDVALDCAAYEISGGERSMMRQTVRQHIESDRTRGDGKWMVTQGQEAHYLLRVLKSGSVYYGAWINLNNVVPALHLEGLSGVERLLFTTPEGQVLDQGGQLGGEALAKAIVSQDNGMQVDGRTYLVMRQAVSHSDLLLVGLIDDAQILEGLDSMQNLISALFLSILVLVPIFIWMIRRWMIGPINNLVKAMKNLASGELREIPIAQTSSEEFRMVNQTFNEMTRQIKALKIDVYEQRLRQQKTELQFLQLQVNPHFVINCLNIIHNLAAMKKCDLIQKMAEHLGRHLRYTLYGASTTSLKEELGHIGNYVEIQQLRFPGCLRYSQQADETLFGIPVPPLCIQTFVENAVKYQVVAGETTALSVCVKRVEEKAERFLHILVTDDGEGYPEGVLQAIAERKRLVDQRGEHIGISNLIQRLALLYGEKARVKLYNDVATGGATAELWLPITP